MHLPSILRQILILWSAQPLGTQEFSLTRVLFLSNQPQFLFLTMGSPVDNFRDEGHMPKCSCSHSPYSSLSFLSLSTFLCFFVVCVCSSFFSPQKETVSKDPSIQQHVIYLPSLKQKESSPQYTNSFHRGKRKCFYSYCCLRHFQNGQDACKYNTLTSKHTEGRFHT